MPLVQHLDRLRDAGVRACLLSSLPPAEQANSLRCVYASASKFSPRVRTSASAVASAGGTSTSRGRRSSAGTTSNRVASPRLSPAASRTRDSARAAASPPVARDPAAPGVYAVDGRHHRERRVALADSACLLRIEDDCCSRPAALKRHSEADLADLGNPTPLWQRGRAFWRRLQPRPGTRSWMTRLSAAR